MTAHRKQARADDQYDTRARTDTIPGLKLLKAVNRAQIDRGLSIKQDRAFHRTPLEHELTFFRLPDTGPSEAIRGPAEYTQAGPGPARP